MNMKTCLLRHYATKSVTAFLQFDGFARQEPDDGPLLIDGHGDALCAGPTLELMHGATVRVLIAADADKVDVLRLIDKLAGLIAGTDLEEMAQAAEAERTNPHYPDLTPRFSPHPRWSGVEPQ